MIFGPLGPRELIGTGLGLVGPHMGELVGGGYPPHGRPCPPGGRPCSCWRNTSPSSGVPPRAPCYGMGDGFRGCSSPSCSLHIHTSRGGPPAGLEPNKSVRFSFHIISCVDFVSRHHSISWPCITYHMSHVTYHTSYIILAIYLYTHHIPNTGRPTDRPSVHLPAGG